MKTPRVADGLTSAWAQYALIIDGSPAVQVKFTEVLIPSVGHYPKALTQQDSYSAFPVTSYGVEVCKRLTGKVLSLPIHPYLVAYDQAGIIEVLQQ